MKEFSSYVLFRRIDIVNLEPPSPFHEKGNQMGQSTAYKSPLFLT